MKPWLHKIEVFVDKIIPFLLLVLIFIIVGEFAFHNFVAKYSLAIEIIDWFIIFVFVIDLIFKYVRIRNFPKFLRASWLDIIAIFPFFLVFRFLEGIVGLFGVSESVTSVQKVAHVGIEVEKQVAESIKEGEAIAKEAGRSEKLAKFLRPIARSLRLSKVGDKDTRKEAEEVIKETEKGAKNIIKKTKTIAKEAEKEIKTAVKEAKELEKKITRHIKAALFYEKPKIMEHVNKKINKLNEKIN